MCGPPSTLYEGETFSLSFRFGPKYPFDSPVVVFEGDNIPVHPHVYREGIVYKRGTPDNMTPLVSLVGLIVDNLRQCMVIFKHN